jgi:hypothetical protein
MVAVHSDAWLVVVAFFHGLTLTGMRGIYLVSMCFMLLNNFLVAQHNTNFI